jgi:hypothetical protein
MVFLGFLTSRVASPEIRVGDQSELGSHSNSHDRSTSSASNSGSSWSSSSPIPCML